MLFLDENKIRKEMEGFVVSGDEEEEENEGEKSDDESTVIYNIHSL